MKIFSDGDENEAEMTLLEWINTYAVSRGIDYIILDWYNNIYENAPFLIRIIMFSMKNTVSAAHRKVILMCAKSTHLYLKCQCINSMR